MNVRIRRISRSFLAAIAVAGSLVLGISTAQTATINWTGTTNATWATGSNWGGGVAPGNSTSTDIANFNLATYGGNPVFAPNAGTTSINGITIGASNGAMTLTTTNLTIGNGSISIANGAGAFTLNGTTTLGANQTWTNNSTNLFTFGAVTNNANTLTIGGSGNTTASGVIGNGAGGLTKEGAGLLTLNAANTYTGATTVNGGELRWGIANAIAGGALNINDGGTVNMQTFSDTVGTITIAKGGSITGTSGNLTTPSFISNNGGTMTGVTLTFSTSNAITYNSTGPGSTALQIGTLTVNDTGSTIFDIADGDAAVDFDITGFVNNGGSNVGRTIVKTGAGAMQFSGNTTGAAGQNGIFLNINQGTVLMNRATGVAFAPGSALLITVGDGIGSAGSAMLKFANTGGNDQLGSRPITINSDGLFDLNGKAQTTTGALTLNSTGQLQLNNGQLTVTSLTLNPSTGNTTTLSLGASGTLTLGGDVTLNAAGTGQAQITGSALSLGAANRIFNIGLGTGANYDLLVGAGISGASRLLTKNGMGRLVLTGNNTYSGGTTVNAGTLQIGDGTSAGTMTSTGALTMGGGTFGVLAPASGGSNQTVASLATSASTGSTIRLTPGASGNTTLTITSATLSTGAGSSLNFDYTAGTTVGGTVGNNYVVWSPTLTGGIIGGAYTVTDSGGTGFATTSGGNVVRLTDPGSAGLPVSGGNSTTGSYFVASGYSTVSTTTPGSLVLALSGALSANNVTVNTTGLASGANLALGTNLLNLGAGMMISGPNAYQITGSGAGGLRAASANGTINLYNANTNTVTISAPIVANSTASRLTVDGPGTTILSGNNTYTGATVINGGTVNFSGIMAASPITINNAAVAQLGTATGLTSSNTVTFGAGATGSLQLLGNNLTIGALNSNATTLGTPVITNNNGGGPLSNATLTINSASASSFGGVIQDGTGGGTLALTNSGAGTLTLSGVNTYSGGTVINAGTVSVTTDANLGNASGGITLNGGRLTIASATLSTARNITVTGTGSSMVANKNNTFSTSGALTGSGSITFVDPGGSGNIPIYTFSSSGNTFTGSVTMNGADVRVSSLGDAAGNNLVFTNAGTFSLNSSGVTAGLTFNNRAIELSNTSPTVSNNNANYAITIGSNLVATGGAAKVLTLSAAAGPTNVFSGNISDGTGGGTVAITKSGAGTWVLGNSTNSYTGQTSITAGTLIISKMANDGQDSSIGKGTAGTNVRIGGTLIYTGSGDNTNRVTDVSIGNAIILNNGTGALNFTASTFNAAVFTGTGRTFTLGGTNGGTISGAIQDNSTSVLPVVKSGIGTWVFAGNNTYNGTTTTSGGGTLVLDYTNNTSKLSDSAALTLGAGAINLVGGNHTEVVASTTLTANEGVRINRLSGNSTLQLGAITRNNSSTLSFSANNIATTNTTNTNGILGTWATVGSNWAVNSTNGANGLIVGLSSYTTLPTTGGNGSVNYQLTGNQTQTGDVTTNTVRIVNSGNSDTLALGTRALNLGTGTGGLIYAGGFDDNYTISGTTGAIKSQTPNNQIVLNVFTGTLTVNALLNTGSAVTSKFGAGTLVVGGNNTSSGAFYHQEGVVRLTHNSALGTTAGGVVVQNGAALEFANSVAIGAEAATITGTGVSNGGAFRNVAGNTSSYAGAITLGVGGARINSDLNGSLTLSGGVVTSLNNDVTFGGAGSTTVSTGAVSGAGGLIKDGIGSLSLASANTYTGATNVSAGTLIVSGSGSINTTSAINVAAGARFANNSSVALALAPTLSGNGTGSRAVYGGTGTLNAALTLDNVGDVLSPGNSPGIQTFGVNQSWASNSYDWELNDWTASVAGTNIDQINITGNLTLTGATPGSYILNVLSLTSGNVTGLVPNFSDVNNSWTILTTTTGISGFDASYWTISTGNFTSSPTATGTWNIAQSGNNLVLNYVAVPEPAAIALLASGVAILGYRVARRRRG